VAAIKRKQRLTRKEQAAATRRSIIGAAHRLFVRDGYVATTMADIGDEAGVAVQTVYFVFSTKAKLLLEVVHSASAREGEPTDPAQRSWVQEADSSGEPVRAFALSIEGGSDIFTRIGPLIPMIQAASATDDDVAAEWDSMLRHKHDTVQRMMAVLDDGGHLRPGIDADQATDIFVAVSSVEMYQMLVTRLGWTPARFKAWTYQTVCEQLLRPDVAKRYADPDVLEGVAFADELRGSALSATRSPARSTRKT
jgi:AcrR family transcriptional regulator